MSLKLKACRFGYEYLGMEVADLCDQYGYMPLMIDREIQVANWQRKVEMPSLPEVKDLANFASALEIQARDRLKVLALYKQIEHQPIIAQIETALLEKMRDVVQSIDVDDTYSASKITSLVNAINSIQANAPVITTDQTKSAGGQDGKVIVNIQNNI